MKLRSCPTGYAPHAWCRSARASRVRDLTAAKLTCKLSDCIAVPDSERMQVGQWQQTSAVVADWDTSRFSHERTCDL